LGQMLIKKRQMGKSGEKTRTGAFASRFNAIS
jgi:hypothetical protein